ncbi:LamG-like jellyroll fold domain-containing protein [Chitinophaga sp. Hz27]|uniref:LamG-like jellyroll fold domain-containing protein n=1 Tax=Chitinophaga sp. Hz27 TaxID=3347169 RepID=UPI0035D7636F
MKKFYLTLMALVCLYVANAQTKKILLIGIDGTRWDAVLAANAPTLDSLRTKSVYTLDGLTETPTWSAVGWSAMLTGVWRAKHGVYDNTFTGGNFTTYPSFLQRVETASPGRRTVSICHWAPINTYIVNGIDAEQNPTTDLAVKNAVVAELSTNNPDVLFMHFDDVDEAGHSYGFSPTVPQYVSAIEEVDGYIHEILTALKSRSSYASEDWLVAVSTDHGGNMAGHGGSSLEERNIFAIWSNSNFVPQQIKKDTVSINMPGSYLSLSNGSYLKPVSNTYNFGAATDFTIECRVKLNSGFAGDPSIISNKNWANGKNKGFIFSAVSGNSWKVNVGDSLNRVDLNGNIIADGKWHHLAVTFDRDGLVKMYEDGTLVNSASMAGIGNITSAYPLAIGQDGTLSYGYKLDGSIAEVRIWDKVIPENELITWMSKAVTAAHPSYASLHSYWKGAEGTGTSWADNTTASNTASVYGTPVWQTAATPPPALLFGSGAYAKPAASTAYQFDTSNFTLECRVKTSTWSGDPAILANKNWSSGTKKGYIIAANSGGKWKVNIGNGTNRADVNGGTIADGQWHHIAVSVNRSGYMITYQDGVKVDSVSVTAVTGGIASALPFAIAQDGTLAYSYPFTGNISDVRIWNTVIPAAAINAWKDKDITTAHPNYSALIGYWKAHEGSGSTLADASSSANYATVVNASWQAGVAQTSFTYNVYNNTPRQVDMAVSCLDYLGIPINSSWGLDGKSWIPTTGTALASSKIINNSVQVLVTPNPVSTELTLQVQSANQQPGDFILYNTSKQQVKHHRQQVNKGTQLVRIGVGDLPAGMYVLELKTPAGSVATKVMLVK